MVVERLHTPCSLMHKFCCRGLCSEVSLKRFVRAVKRSRFYLFGCPTCIVALLQYRLGVDCDKTHALK